MSQMEIEWKNMGKQGYMSGPVRVRLFLVGIFHLTYDAIGVTLRIYDGNVFIAIKPYFAYDN